MCKNNSSDNWLFQHNSGVVDMCRCVCIYIYIYFSMEQQSLVGQGLLIVEASRSQSHSPYSLWIRWTSDQPVAGTSAWQHTTLTRDRHPCFRRDSNPQSQKAKGHRPTPLTVRPLRSAAYTSIYICCFNILSFYASVAHWVSCRNRVCSTKALYVHHCFVAWQQFNLHCNHEARLP
jgi:hypothetical protein